MKALDELERRIQILEDSKSYQNFQVTDPYSIFQKKHDNLEMSIETMIQCQNDPLDMIEERLSKLENKYRNKETLPTQSLNILDTSSHIEKNQESWYLEDFDQDSILLAQRPITLVLMMINSYSYSTNDLVFN